jgi:hypothetical protein
MAGALLPPADRAYCLAMLRRQLNSAVHRRMNALPTRRRRLAKLLGRIGFVWKRPKCIPAKADAAAQRQVARSQGLRSKPPGD